jgi:hypothetical protein
MMGYVLHMYMTFDRGPQGTVVFLYKNNLNLHMTAEVICRKRLSKILNCSKVTGDGHTDRHTHHSYKGVSPLKIDKG